MSGKCIWAFSSSMAIVAQKSSHASYSMPLTTRRIKRSPLDTVCPVPPLWPPDWQSRGLSCCTNGVRIGYSYKNRKVNAHKTISFAPNAPRIRSFNHYTMHKSDLSLSTDCKFPLSTMDVTSI